MTVCFSNSNIVFRRAYGFTKIKILEPEESLVNIPNILTPNNDGFNDIFVIAGLEELKNEDSEIRCKINVFNIWGDEVFESSDYKNNWDGDGLDAGAYFYIIEITGMKKLLGTINIIY